MTVALAHGNKSRVFDVFVWQVMCECDVVDMVLLPALLDVFCCGIDIQHTVFSWPCLAEVLIFTPMTALYVCLFLKNVLLR